MNPLEQAKTTIASLDVTKRAHSLWQEFRNFAFKGNVVDLAIGVVIGTAFAAIIKSLVDHIIMPLVSIVMPADKGYTEWKPSVMGSEIPVGLFLGNVVNFLIVALVLFIFIVKFLGWITRTKKQEAVVPPPPTKDQELLMEIRDLLKSQAGGSPA